MGSVVEGRAEENNWPKWLLPLLSTSFFGHCKFHSESHRGECNMFCLDCVNGALCPLCLSYHRDHQSIQIRRSSYHDVIRVADIQKVLDIAGVQTYVINSAKVVFLNERPQPRPGKGVVNACEVCDRGLLDSFRFCSLGCKIAGTSKNRVRKQISESASEADDSDSGNAWRREEALQSFTPSTPPPAAASFRAAKRRKGIPHRAPMAGFIVQF